MSKIVVDDELKQRLNGLQPSTELCDPAGQTLGYLVSPEEYLKLRYAWEKQQDDQNELLRLSEETGGRYLKDIIHDLEQSS